MAELEQKIGSQDVALTVDNRGIPCALGIFKVMKAMEELEPGQVLEILSTDRNSKRDLSKWTDRMGHRVLSVHEEGNLLRPVWRFHVRKG